MKNFLKIAVLSLVLCVTFTGCVWDDKKEGAIHNPISLTMDKWEKGSISPGKETAGVKYYIIFARRAATHRIYVKMDTVKNLDIYILNSAYEQIGSRNDFDGDTGRVFYAEWEAEPGKVYYIKAEGSYTNTSGSFWIGYTDFPARPETVFTDLTQNKWTNGNIVSPNNGGTGEQWFTFVATEDTQYIYVKFSTCTDLDLYIYDSNYNQIGDRIDAGGYGWVASQIFSTYRSSLEIGKTYYIKADYGTGNFWIGFTDFPAAPEAVISPLTENEWAQGNIKSQSSGGLGEQWFTFIATDETQYIFVKFSSCTELDLYIYDSDLNQIGSRFDAGGYGWEAGQIDKASRNLVSGQTYYILANNNTGSFWIAFGPDSVAPAP